MQYLRAYDKQERFHEDQLTTDKARKMMYDDINWDNKRTNVDSAKKLACK